MDEDTKVMERSASDNEYFHQSFHASLNRSLNYVGEHYGEEGVRGVLRRYVQNVVQPLMGQVNLAAIEQKIKTDYLRDKAADAVQTELTDSALTVTVRECPGVRYMTQNGIAVTKWYPYSTWCVMEELARLAGCAFAVLSYDAQTGASQYRFTKQ